MNSLGGPDLRTDGLRVSVFVMGVDEYLAESGDAEDDLALLQDMPSLPKLPWKLPCKEFDNGPGDAGDAVNGDFDLTDSVLDLFDFGVTMSLVSDVYFLSARPPLNSSTVSLVTVSRRGSPPLLPLLKVL